MLIPLHVRAAVRHGTVVVVLGLISAMGVWAEAWTPVAPMPTARSTFVAAVFDGRIYAIGGTDGKVPLTAVEIYDPATDTWTVGTAMPTARGGATYCVLDGRIYVIGGKLGYWEDATTAVEAYDPATDTWTVLSPMPTARYALAVVVRDGKIAAIGGGKGVGDASDPYSPVRAVEVYDPQTDTWDERAPYPPLAEREIVYMRAASYGQEGPIPVITWNPIPGKGGRALQYDFDANTWTDRAPMPVERELFGMCGVAGRIFAISGRDYYNSGRLFPDVLAYNPVTDTWIACPPLPAGLRQPSAAAVDGRIYVLGGGTAEQGGLLRTTVEVYEPDPDQLDLLDQVALVRRSATATAGTLMQTVVDQPTQLEVEVQLDPPSAELQGLVPQLTLDASPVGGPADLPFTSPDGRHYRARTAVSPVSNGIFTLDVWMQPAYDWDLDSGLYPMLSVNVEAFPAGDLPVYVDACAPGWETATRHVESLDLTQSERIHAGAAACAAQTGGGFGGWMVSFETADPVEPFGYTHLHLALHPEGLAPGDGDRLTIALSGSGGTMVDLVAGTWLDWAGSEWQVIDIPIEAFQPQEAIGGIQLSGTPVGTLYLDDLRLVAGQPAPPTAVEESVEAAVPRHAALSQNYPNPFNPVTAIAYELAEPGRVSLAIYNTLGQRVRTLVAQHQLPGAYTVHWDGRDDAGAALASGVYLYRLVVDGRPQQTRRMLLLR